MTHTTSRCRASAARSANGVQSGAICGRVGIAITRSISTTDAERNGTPSKLKEFVRLVHISGSGLRASTAFCGQSTSTGMNLDKLIPGSTEMTSISSGFNQKDYINCLRLQREGFTSTASTFNQEGLHELPPASAGGCSIQGSRLQPK
jgi:hypothetical protein